MSFLVMNKMIEYFGSDVRRINHALKVYSFASLIASSESADAFTNDVVNYSALLHDIGIKEAERKFGSSSGHHQEIEGPPVATEILTGLNIDKIIIDRVSFIIAHHHTYKAIDGIDFQIIVEADFLVNIYEDEMEQNSIESVYNNIFTTETGKKLMKTIYLK